MLATQMIEKGEAELYIYGFFLLISKAFFFVVTVIVGFLLGIPATSIVFYISFQLLRGYAGGIHAKTEAACTVLTTLAIIISVIAISIMLTYKAQLVPVLMLIAGGISIFILSPLDTVAKPLSELEKTQYRRITILILFGYLMGVVIARCLNWMNIAYAVTTSIFLESLLLIAGKLQDHSVQ